MNLPNSAPVPAHVPKERVFDFDFWNLDQATDDPFAHFTSLERRGAPSIFWTPRNGGHWVFCRYEDVFAGYRDWDTFSAARLGIPARVGPPPRLIPNELDPPDHERMRSVLAPYFSPAAVRALEADVRARAAGLIEAFAARGRCDYIAEFSARFPTGIFLHIIGLPESELPQFMAWEDLVQRSTAKEDKERGSNAIYAYLGRFIEEKAQHLSEDIASDLLRYRDAEDKKLSREEIVSACHLMYLAGLDTVLNTLGFIFRHLAGDPSARRYVREYVDRLPQIVEEFLRIFATPALSRRVRHDTVYQGVDMKAGDAVLLPNMLANRDPVIYDDPETVKLDRDPKHALTFGAGPHRCLGSHLAKRELVIALDEWFKRIPEFTLDPKEPLTYASGHTVGIRNLPLIWKV